MPRAQLTLQTNAGSRSQVKLIAWGSKLMSTSDMSAEQRAAIKAQIATLNQQALAADSNMRAALTNRNSQAAEQYRLQRDAYNAEAKRLTELLNPTTIPVTPKPRH